MTVYCSQTTVGNFYFFRRKGRTESQRYCSLDTWSSERNYTILLSTLLWTENVAKTERSCEMHSSLDLCIIRRVHVGQMAIRSCLFGECIPSRGNPCELLGHRLLQFRTHSLSFMLLAPHFCRRPPAAPHSVKFWTNPWCAAERTCTARTAASIATSELSLFTADPTPTPAAPAARASGAVRELIPEAAMVGMRTALEMAAVAASVGAAFSISPCSPANTQPDPPLFRQQQITDP